MGKLILVTGGARSGKSYFAEQKVGEFGEKILYIATSIPFDEEMKLRIKKHKAQRPSNWRTVESYKDMDMSLKGKLENVSAAMLDCITIMVSNVMLEQNIDWDNLSSDEFISIEDKVKNEIEKLLITIEAAEKPFILVTNEIGMGIVPDNPMSRAFRDIAGRTNQMLAKKADEVYLCVSGIPIKIK